MSGAANLILVVHFGGFDTVLKYIAFCLVFFRQFLTADRTRWQASGVESKQICLFTTKLPVFLKYFSFCLTWNPLLGNTKK